MPFDALVVAALENELSSELVNSRITKIYQPGPLEFTFTCRRPGRNLTLVIRVDPSNPGLYLSDSNWDNPKTPPAFCMLLRKHLENGRIAAVTQPGFERILEIEVENIDDSGDLVTRTIIAEIMGRYSNMVLLDENRVIFDAARRVSSEVNRVRELLPGVEYVDPPPQQKADPLSLSRDRFYNLTYPSAGNSKLANVLVKQLQGISPLTAKEIVKRSGHDSEALRSDIDEAGFEKLWQTTASLFEDIKSGAFAPSVIYEGKEPKDYSAIRITHLEGEAEIQEIASISDALNRFLEEKAKSAALSRVKSDLNKVLSTNLNRVKRKIEEQQATLTASENADELRIKGELLTASLHMLKTGDTKASVPNYYSIDQEPLTIDLDPTKSPAANAQSYFKKYGKLKNSVRVTKEQLVKSAEESKYLSQVLALVESAEEVSDLEEIRQELIDEGYITVKKQQKKTQKASQPESVRSSDGIELLIGHNNRQNDQLTMSVARTDDIWLHVKDIPGSHVIIRTGKNSVPDRTLEEAAILAAYYSKARESSKVPVDYTLRKNVRKPKGSRPGMVIYDNQQTVYVDPTQELVARIKNSSGKNK